MEMDSEIRVPNEPNRAQEGSGHSLHLARYLSGGAKREGEKDSVGSGKEEV